MISLYGEVALVYCSITKPDSDFHLLRLKKINLSKIRMYVCIYWYLMTLTKDFFQYFCQLNWNRNIYFSLNLFTTEGTISMSHEITCDLHIFSKFNFKFLWICMNSGFLLFSIIKKTFLRVSNYNINRTSALNSPSYSTKNINKHLSKKTFWR